jgi:hypothetical protein
MADYISQTDLENALGVKIVRAVYDDDGDKVVDTGPIAACIAYANAECNSFLRNVLVTSSGTPITIPISNVPDEVKFAALDFGIAYTLRRRPDVIKAMAGEMSFEAYYKLAKEKMERYCESVQRVPLTTGTHATAGAAIHNPDSDDDGNEEDLPTEGRWTDLGDFA